MNNNPSCLNRFASQSPTRWLRGTCAITLSLVGMLPLAGIAADTGQQPSRGRVYIGPARNAPAWVWEVPSSSAFTNQMVANAAWLSRVEAIAEQQRSKSKNATLRDDSGGPQNARERGIILNYEPKTDSGIISGDDGKRWLFRGADWAEYRDPYVSGSLATTVGPRSVAVIPSKGMGVDFVPEAGTGYALDVYSLNTFVSSPMLDINLRNRK